ncbi:uncharacterized protein [Nicotiana sylvestris]|uniref:uncharacterized protein n=1 Tax=Nicotiana sylvestris TaxID=4096 RepID=UPI00388CAD28
MAVEGEEIGYDSTLALMAQSDNDEDNVNEEESEEEEALAGLRNLFLDDEDMDCNAIVEKEADIIITYPDEPTTMTYNETMQPKDSDLEEIKEEHIIPEEIVREVENFENKPKSNLDETKIVNLGYFKTIKETHISIHLSPSEKEEYTHFLKEYEDIFAWFYDDMTGLRMYIVAHKLPTNLMCPPIKQKLRKFKQDMGLRIKEEVTKQIKAKVLRVVEYPTWLANIVPVAKKDGKEIEVYVDDVINKSKKGIDHIVDLRKFFDWLQRYNLKLNHTKCAFGVPAVKLLGFIISHRGIKLDPSKVKAIQDLPPPKNRKDFQQKRELVEQIQEELKIKEVETLGWRQGMDSLAYEKETLREQLASLEYQLKNVKEESLVRGHEINELKAKSATELAKAKSDVEAIISSHRADAEAANARAKEISSTVEIKLSSALDHARQAKILEEVAVALLSDEDDSASGFESGGDEDEVPEEEAPEDAATENVTQK